MSGNLPRVSVLLSLYNADEYLNHYFSAFLEQTILNEIQLSIVANAPTSSTRSLIERYSDRISIVYQEVSRESLYRSWNRAILQSSSPYLTIWNVDDCRYPDSIEKMASYLDSHPDIGWTYSDFLVSTDSSGANARHIVCPDLEPGSVMRGAIAGPFFMWRRSIANETQYFDEQFYSAGDFDYMLRLHEKSKAGKTPGVSGVFRDFGGGLSTKGLTNTIERTAVQLRHKIYERIDIVYVPTALVRYDTKSLHLFGEKVAIYNPRPLRRLGLIHIIFLPLYYTFFKKYLDYLKYRLNW